MRLFMLFYLIIILISCQSNKKYYTDLLNDLENQLDQYPEMVGDSLKSIEPNRLSEPQKAHYYLLEAIATDKNLQNLQKDSTLLIAIQYYKQTKEYYRLSYCQYYLGKYIKKNGKKEDAYNMFKQAETNYNQGSQADPHLIGLIYYHLSLIQKQQRNLNEANDYVLSSLHEFSTINDTLSIVHALKLLGTIYINKKEYDLAEEKLQEAVRLISLVGSKTRYVIETKASTLNLLGLLYRYKKKFDTAFLYFQKCLFLFEKYDIETPSQYYYNAIMTFSYLNLSDSVKYYCYKMIDAAQEEDNYFNQINGYRILFDTEEKNGNYKEACLLKTKFNTIKDSMNAQTSKRIVLELEKKYNITEKQKELLRAENNNLRAYAIISVILFGIFIIGFPFYNRHRKLKLKYQQLSEEVKHTEWGFLVTKEFIHENHVAYDELEKLLNRYCIHHLNSELYNKFQDAFIQQKANYSERLFTRLTNFDGNFIKKFQKQFSGLSSDELLMSAMIKHQWKVSDMMAIFHVSADAIRKRKARLANKLSSKLKTDILLEEYLQNF